MTISDKINGSKCIINLATGRYVVGQDRLRNSLVDVGYTGEFIGWTAEHQIGAPLHKDNPYSFKIHGFREAERQGHRFVLWLDASVWAIKDVQPIFDHIEREGYIMQYSGHNCGRWSSDKQLEYFGVTRDEAMELGMYGNAGFLGLDLWDTYAKTFLLSWEKAMKAGMFKGAWNNDNKTESQDPRCAGSRHDMSTGSLIANQLNMKYQNAEEWLNYGTEPLNDKVYLLARGI